MSRGWQYVPGDWQVTCDVCSRSVFASEIKKRWDGLLVCSADYETRHPQDLLRVRQERIAVPFSRPQSEDVFTTISYITIYVDYDYVEETRVGIGRQTYFEES